MREVLTAADFDEVLGECLDELPENALGELVVRVAPRPLRRAGAEDSTHVTFYREPLLRDARGREDLRERMRAELARRVEAASALR